MGGAPSLAIHFKHNFNRYIAKHAEKMTYGSTANTFYALLTHTPLPVDKPHASPPLRGQILEPPVWFMRPLPLTVPSYDEP